MGHPMKRKPLLRGCLLYGIILMVVVIAIAALVFVINNRPVTVSVPTPKMPSPNGWDDFVKAGEMIKQINHQGPEYDYPPRQWSVAELKSFVKANEPAFVVFRQGLAKPYLHPPIRSNRDLDESVLDTGKIRRLGWELTGESQYYSTIGEYEKAANSTLDAIELGVTILRGGSFFTGSAGEATEIIGFKHFNKIIAKLDSNALSHVAQRMEKIQRKRVSFSDMVLEDGRIDKAIFADKLHSSTYRNEIRNPVKLYFVSKRKQYVDIEYAVDDIKYVLRSCFANKAAEVKKFEDYYAALTAEQCGPYTGKSRVPIPADNIMLRGSLIKNIGMLRSPFECNKAIFTLYQTQVALRRYYAEHNQYPMKLSQLAPKYLKSEPIDPFGLGKPLKYRQLAKGKDYLLYSLSTNLSDDHGKPGDMNSLVGDLVAGKLIFR